MQATTKPTYRLHGLARAITSLWAYIGYHTDISAFHVEEEEKFINHNNAIYSS